MKPCFGYIRVSTQKQGEGVSLEAQRDAILAFAAAVVPGFLSVETSGVGFAIRAGGALGVFVLAFFFNPAQILARDSVELETKYKLCRVDDQKRCPNDSTYVSCNDQIEEVAAKSCKNLAVSMRTLSQGPGG